MVFKQVLMITDKQNYGLNVSKSVLKPLDLENAKINFSS